MALSVYVCVCVCVCVRACACVCMHVCACVCRPVARRGSGGSEEPPSGKKVAKRSTILVYKSKFSVAKVHGLLNATNE